MLERALGRVFDLDAGVLDFVLGGDCLSASDQGETGFASDRRGHQMHGHAVAPAGQ